MGNSPRREMGAPPVRYVRSRSGARIAWAAAGEGRPTLFSLSAWVTHLTADWTERELGRFYRALASRHRVLRFDRPGVGVADRHGFDFSLEAQIDDALRVLDAAGERQVAVLARTMGVPLAISLAVLHPERVSKLILFGGAPSIVARPSWPLAADPELAKAIRRLVEVEWGLGSRTLCNLMLGTVDPRAVEWYAEYQRSAATAEVATAIIAANMEIDVTELVGRIAVPTLVLHRRDDQSLSVANAHRMADLISGARLVVLDGAATLPFFGDGRAVIAAIDAFLDPVGALLTGREVEILVAVAEGLGNRDLADRLSLSEHTVARHLANIYLKLDVGSRSAAVARARAAGVLPSG